MENTSEKRELVAKGLDFFQIKNNLKNFLRSQETFKDYNFESSSMNVLLDILAYNTHYNAFYSNMVVNESFLDSAILRESVVSLSKHLGYIPRSDQGSECLVDVRVSASAAQDQNAISEAVNNGLLKVKKFDIFKAFVNQDTFYFYSTNDVEFKREIVNNVSQFWARGVKIREGTLKIVNFVVDKALPEQRFLLQEPNVDTRSISIKVQRSPNSTEGLTDKWYRETDFNNLDSNSRVFFVQEIHDGKQEIYFGDGVIGRSPDHGNVISVIYSTTVGSLSNNIGRYERPNSTTFTHSMDGLIVDVSLQKDSNGNPIPTTGGGEKESTTSIKFYAPKRYTSQDRAVTLDDYVNYLSGNYSESYRSVYAWGGEDNDPPEYGKVFISIRPKNSTFLSDSEKNQIVENVLASRNVVSVVPKIVDPEYVYIIPKISIKYNERELRSNVNNLRSSIMQTIYLYNQANLSSFNGNFYTSDLINTILEVDPAIKSCTIDITVKKYITPSLNRKFTYKINFQNPIQKLTDKEYYFESSFFRTNDIIDNFAINQTAFGFLRDDGFGRIKKYKRVVDDRLITLNNNQGNIDYESGKITLSNLEVYPETLSSSSVFSVSVKPKDLDFISRTNLILEIEIPSISLDMKKI